MPFVNTPKPSAGTQTNIPRVVDYETWDTITTTWATETRTWDMTASELINSIRPSSTGLTNTIKPS